MKKIDIWIHTKEELLALVERFDIRPDWHEIECWGFDVTCRRRNFDNAFCDDSETHFVLKVDLEDEKILRVAVNAATLFAWACGWEDPQQQAA